MDLITFIFSVCMMHMCVAYTTADNMKSAGNDRCDIKLRPVSRWYYIYSGKRHVIYRKKDVILCTELNCWKAGYEEVQASYGNTFFSTTEYSLNTALPYVCSDNSDPECLLQQQQAPSDGSKCCPTLKYATYYGNGDNMDNIAGEECSIIHLLEKKQMVTEGICRHSETCDGGVCTQMYRKQTLLAWNHATGSLGTEYFNIPTYCTCMNFSINNLRPAQMASMSQEPSPNRNK